MSEDSGRPEESDAELEDELEDDGVLQPGDSLETDDLASDPLDTGYSPQERRPASEGYGVTLAEARAGESLDQRLAEEEPDFGAPAAEYRPELEEDAPPLDDDEPQPRAGRLVAADEGAHGISDPEYFARDIGIDGGAASAEEAAMHVIGEDGEDNLDDDDYSDESFGDLDLDLDDSDGDVDGDGELGGSPTPRSAER